MTTRARGSWEAAHTIRTPDGFRCRVVGSDGQIAAIVHGRTAGECEANTRLIANAPNLLAELKCFFDMVGVALVDSGDCLKAEEARAALAILTKAGG